MGLGIATAALCVALYGALSARLSALSLTGPLVFVVFGFALGEAGFGLLDLSLDNAVVHTLAELALVVVLFADASRIDLRVLRRFPQVPVRLLGLALPASLALGTLVALLLLPGLSGWEAALLAAVLVPTDAALGQGVITDQRVPVRVRQALNVESGLNDGLAVPFVTVFVAAASMTQQVGSAGSVAGLVATQIGVGVGVGVGAGVLMAWLLTVADRRGWSDPLLRPLGILAVAVLVFAGASAAGGNGFIAAFSGGLALGTAARGVCQDLFAFAEREGHLLVLVTFLVFGAGFVGPALPQLSWQVVAYVLASLTVVRMAPVAVALLGVGLRPATLALIGWFGPRGLASIVLGLMVVDDHGLAGGEQVLAVVTWTVLTSIVAHGLSARPGVGWYTRRVRALPAEPAAEMQPVDELPTRSPAGPGSRA